jgi:hypothetical protein
MFFESIRDVVPPPPLLASPCQEISAFQYKTYCRKLNPIGLLSYQSAGFMSIVHTGKGFELMSSRLGIMRFDQMAKAVRILGGVSTEFTTILPIIITLPSQYCYFFPYVLFCLFYPIFPYFPAIATPVPTPLQYTVPPSPIYSTLEKKNRIEYNRIFISWQWWGDRSNLSICLQQLNYFCNATTLTLVHTSIMIHTSLFVSIHPILT